MMYDEFNLQIYVKIYFCALFYQFFCAFQNKNSSLPFPFGMKHYSYKTVGTCSERVDFDVDDNNLIHNVSFLGGCNGNLQGIGRLVEGMPVNDVIERLRGIRCGANFTSCPDQLAHALENASASL